MLRTGAWTVCALASDISNEPKHNTRSSGYDAAVQHQTARSWSPNLHLYESRFPPGRRLRGRPNKGTSSPIGGPGKAQGVGELHAVSGLLHR